MKMLTLPAIDTLHTIHLYDSQKRRAVPVACIVTGHDGEQVVVRYRDMNGNMEEIVVHPDMLSSR